jgi:hypothetical protein
MAPIFSHPSKLKPDIKLEFSLSLPSINVYWAEMKNIIKLTKWKGN